MYKMNPPAWCALKHNGIKEAILAAAEKSGAKIYQSASFVFKIDDFEIVEAYFKKFGKQSIVDTIIKFCKENKEVNKFSL